MSVVPRQVGPKIEFFQDHVDVWTTNATAIGTTTAAVTDLESKLKDASDAAEAQRLAMQASKAATANLKTAIDALMTSGMSIIESIRSKARIGGDAIYNLAQIPVPSSSHSNKSMPGQCNRFKTELDSTGALLLTWKCENPVGTSGTIYQVYRQIDGAGEYQYLGGSGERKFLDETIPAGTSLVSYQVQAVRSNAKGPWSEFTVKFSTNAGVTTATVGQASAAKLAA